MDGNEMKKYVAEHLKEMNDYSFMGERYADVVSALVELENEYIDALEPDDSGECEYDDDAAYEYVLKGIRSRFKEFEMYSECLVDDYLEVSEKYLSENGDIDWE